MSTFKLTNVPLSYYSRDDIFNKGKKRRTVSINMDSLADVPEELFALKVSQSRNPELAGKVVFKYFLYKLSAESAWSSLAPGNFTIQTPLSEVKQAVMAKLDHSVNPNTVLRFTLKLHGSWGNIETSDGAYALYDEEHYPATGGEPNYYLKANTIGNVEMTEAENQGNSYLQVNLSTDLSPEEIFQLKGKAAVHYYGEGASDNAESGNVTVNDPFSSSDGSGTGDDNPWA